MVIRTNSASTTLTINDNTDGKIYHYDTLSILNVTKCGYSCYYEYGTTAYAEAIVGKIVAKEGGIIFVLYATAAIVAAQEDGGTIGAAYCAGTASNYDSFSDTKSGNIDFTAEANIKTKKNETVAEAKNNDLKQQGYAVRIDNKGFASFAEVVEYVQTNKISDSTIYLLSDVEISTEVTLGYANEDAGTYIVGIEGIKNASATNPTDKFYAINITNSGRLFLDYNADGEMTIDANIHSSSSNSKGGLNLKGYYKTDLTINENITAENEADYVNVGTINGAYTGEVSHTSSNTIYNGTTLINVDVTGGTFEGNTTITGAVSGGSFESGSTTTINGNVVANGFKAATFLSGSTTTINGKISYGEGFNDGCLIKSENATFDTGVYIYGGTFSSNPSEAFNKNTALSKTSSDGDNPQVWQEEWNGTYYYQVTYDADSKTYTVTDD